MKCTKNMHVNARNRKLWKEKRREITKGKKCIYCDEKGTNKNPLVIHHTQRKAYLKENIDLYASLSEELKFQIVCKRCHLNLHKGYNLCPVCKKKYMRREYVRCYVCNENIKVISLHDQIHNELGIPL